MTKALVFCHLGYFKRSMTLQQGEVVFLKKQVANILNVIKSIWICMYIQDYRVAHKSRVLHSSLNLEKNIKQLN